MFPNAPAGLYYPGDPGFPTKAGMNKRWGNFGPRVGLAWDPMGNGLTNVRASYGRSFEFVNAQFHLNTSVAPPWGSEVRLNAPPGGLDNPFLGSPGGLTNIFPVTFDQQAPFSLNGPFLSLSNDMRPTTVDMWNIAVERQFARTWLASAGYVGSRTEPYLGVHAAQQCAVRDGQRRRPERGQHRTLAVRSRSRIRRTADFIGPTDMYVTDGKQRYNGLLLSVRRSAARGVTFSANYALSHCYGSPDGNGGGTTNLGVGYNKPEDPGFDDGNCTADRLHNFSMTAGVESPRFENAALRAVGDRLAAGGKFPRVDRPWLTVTAGTDRALERAAEHAAGQPGSRQPVRRSVQQPAEQRHQVPEPAGLRDPGHWHARHDPAQQHQGSGQQERRHGADESCSAFRAGRASKSGPRRSTPSTGSSGDQPATALQQRRRSVR